MDLNQDGHKDILSGSYSRRERPMAGLFQVLWGQADGTFKKAEVLKGTDDQPLVIPHQSREQIRESVCTRPLAIDWDGDDDLDLIVGNFEGSFYLFKGEGGGKFSPTADLILDKNGDPLKVKGWHSDPFVIDWDGDGDVDILSGSGQGGVQWAENKSGESGRMQLAPFVTLISANTAKHPQRLQAGKLPLEKDLTGPSRSTRVWVDDINADGKLDILLGDSVMVAAPDIDGKENLEKKPQTNSIRGLFQKGDRTGFVWLYLGK